MNPILTSLIAFAAIFGGALIGIAIRPLLSRKHRHPESKDAVRLAMGILGTLTALVLGFAIATGKSSFDEKNAQIKHIVAKINLLDNLLAQFGPEAIPSRQLLRKSIDPFFDRIWNEEITASGTSSPFVAATAPLALVAEIERLQPGNDSQRSLQARAIQVVSEITQMRLLLFAQAGKSIPIPFLIALVLWLAVIFASFALFAKANLVVVAVLLVGALSAAGSIFIALEMDQPFEGLMAIPSAPLRNALPAL